MRLDTKVTKLALDKSMHSSSLVVAGRKAEDMGTDPHVLKFGVFKYFLFIF